MKFTLTIDMDNAAFEPSPFDEIRRVFDSAMDHAATYGIPSDGEVTLRDSNGNTVGRYEVSNG